MRTQRLAGEAWRELGRVCFHTLSGTGSTLMVSILVIFIEFSYLPNSPNLSNWPKHGFAPGVPTPRAGNCLSHRGDAFLDVRHQIFIIKWSVVTLAIEEECWRAVDPAAHSTGKIGAYPLREFALLQGFAQSGRVDV